MGNHNIYAEVAGWSVISEAAALPQVLVPSILTDVSEPALPIQIGIQYWLHVALCQHALAQGGVW